jgi:hypothetical protein
MEVLHQVSSGIQAVFALDVGGLSEADGVSLFMGFIGVRDASRTVIRPARGALGRRFIVRPVPIECFDARRYAYCRW